MPNNCYDSTTTSPQSPLNLQMQQQHQQQQQQQQKEREQIVVNTGSTLVNTGSSESPHTPVNGSSSKQVTSGAALSNCSATSTSSSSSSSSSSNNSLMFSPSSAQLPTSSGLNLAKQLPILINNAVTPASISQSNNNISNGLYCIFYLKKKLLTVTAIYMI